MGLALLIYAGCENVDNPVNEMGEQIGPYVRFQAETAVGAPESVVNVIVQLPTTIEEDVDYTVSFGGDAVYGEDFTIVDTDGNVRGGFSAEGGTSTIFYDAEETSIDRDTLFVAIDFDAVDGRQLSIQLVEAESASGREVLPGRGELFTTFDLSLEGFVDIPVGTYVGSRVGFSPADAEVTIAKPDGGIDVGGDLYFFEISDFTGAGDLFGVGIPWAFNVTSGGTVVGADESHVFDLGAAVSGTYNFDSQALSLDVVYTQNGSVFEWAVVVSLDE
ncbi:hypothetical protein QA596_07385 [Balneolales bacterium ANBcel1]|nr:hypothetical protein [Balneolales bacterium ANBcel1]